MGAKEEYLRRRMDEKRISQADLSRLTDIPPGTISSFLRSEEGIEKTSYSNVRKICDALGLSVDDLERVTPDGKLPEEETPEAVAIGTGTLPDATGTPGPEASVAGDGSVPDDGAADEPVGDPDMETESVPEEESSSDAGTVVPGFDPEGFCGYDPEKEGLLEIRRYFVVSRLAACSEDDIGRMVSVIPSVHDVEENGMYAVKLPGSRMTVLRKVWRMEGGSLLLGSDRFDETPRIIHPGTEGFSVVGKVVEDGDTSAGLC